MMIKKMRQLPSCRAAVVFMPALTPMEAAVLPAQERKTYGTLGMIRYAYEAAGAESCRPQRAKI